MRGPVGEIEPGDALNCVRKVGRHAEAFRTQQRAVRIGIDLVAALSYSPGQRARSDLNAAISPMSLRFTVVAPRDVIPVVLKVNGSCHSRFLLSFRPRLWREPTSQIFFGGAVSCVRYSVGLTCFISSRFFRTVNVSLRTIHRSHSSAFLEVAPE